MKNRNLNAFIIALVIVFSTILIVIIIAIKMMTLYLTSTNMAFKNRADY